MLFQESDGKSSVKDSLIDSNISTRILNSHQKYKLMNLEPGIRYQHPIIHQDLEKLQLEQYIHGIKSKKGNNIQEVFSSNTNTNTTTNTTIGNIQDSYDLQQIKQMKQEMIYSSTKQQPLGKSKQRNYQYPSNTITTCNIHMNTKSHILIDSVKAILYPINNMNNESLQKEQELYRKSHGTYNVGEQVNRQYQWKNGLDPQSIVFGTRINNETNPAFNGNSINISNCLQQISITDNQYQLTSKKLEEYQRTSSHTLGKSKNLGQDSDKRSYDFIYGKLGKKTKHSAKEVMHGNYSLEQQEPDHDLGKSLTPGFRNISIDNRAFGVPSIRYDLASHGTARVSVADTQNYGDDVIARDLLNPPAFADIGIPSDSMMQLRSKSSILDIFDSIGYNTIDIRIKDILYNKAKEINSNDLCSINSYRDYLNEYLDALEMNREEEWLRHHGLD